MQLPNSLQAYILPEKLTDYLLSETHVVGKAKATFFRKLGFNETNVHLLERELLTLAHSTPVGARGGSIATRHQEREKAN
jgi:hypothetical protein